MSILPESRLRGMDARRQRILDAAGPMLAGGGLAGLTVRAIAEAAGVTVPTLYNLIGSKEQVVAALVAETLARLDAALRGLPPARGLGRARAATQCMLYVITAEPGRYAAMFRALQEGCAAGDHAALECAAALHAQAIGEAREDGDLHGRLGAGKLAAHIARGQAEAFAAWSQGSIDAETMRGRALYAQYVALLADATKQGRRKLLDWITPYA